MKSEHFDDDDDDDDERHNRPSGLSSVSFIRVLFCARAVNLAVVNVLEIVMV